MIRSIYQRYNQPIPAALEQSVASLKRPAGQDLNRSGARRRVARIDLSMMKMDFCLYHRLTEELFALNEPSFSSHLYMLLIWNLMSTASGVDSIRLDHLRWQDDALQVMMPHPEGAPCLDGVTMHPWHVYANPLMPHMCPIVALGIYLLTHQLSHQSAALFNGTDHRQRYIHSWLLLGQALLS